MKVNSQKMCSVQTILKYVGYSAGEMSENSGGRVNSNVVGMICPSPCLVEIGLTDLRGHGTPVTPCSDSPELELLLSGLVNKFISK